MEILESVQGVIKGKEGKNPEEARVHKQWQKDIKLFYETV